MPGLGTVVRYRACEAVPMTSVRIRGVPCAGQQGLSSLAWRSSRPDPGRFASFSAVTRAAQRPVVQFLRPARPARPARADPHAAEVEGDPDGSGQGGRGHAR